MSEGMVLVTGATGAVGPTVVRAFHAAGYSVRTLSIDAPDAAALPPGVDARVGDVRDVRTVQAAVAGTDFVIHLAALLHQFGNSATLDSQYERINVGGTRNVMRAAIVEGVSRVVFFSTIAVYGPSSGRLIDENTPPHPDTPYGRTKLAAEQHVLSARSSGEPIGTVLRAAAAYGPHVKGNYRRLAVSIARRRFVQVGAGANRRTLVYDRDLANAALLAARHPAAAGAVFNVSDGQVHTLAEIVAAICRAVGRKPPRFHVPLSAARVAIGACERGCRLAGLRPPVTRALLDKYTEDVAVEARLVQRALGFVPTVDLERGWLETMVGLQDAGASS